MPALLAAVLGWIDSIWLAVITSDANIKHSVRRLT